MDGEPADDGRSLQKDKNRKHSMEPIRPSSSPYESAAECDELRDLRSKLDETERKLVQQALREKLSSRDEAVARLKDDLTDANRRRTSAEDELASLRAITHSQDKELLAKTMSLDQAVREKRQLEADVADARRSTAKLRRRLAEMRATSEVMHRRTMTLLSHSQTATSAAFSASPHGADCSDEESTDHAAADHQQSLVEEKIRQLQAENAQLQASLNKERQQNASFKQQTCDLHLEQRDLKVSLDELKEVRVLYEQEQRKNASLLDENSCLKTQLKKSGKKVQELQEKLRHLTSMHQQETDTVQKEQQANIDSFEVLLKHEQDERKRAQTKLAEIVSGLSKTYVKKAEADRLTAEVLRSCRAMIGAKLDDWNAALSQQAKSRDQAEQVRCYADSELRQSFDDLRHEFQAEMDACRTVNDELTARARQLERDLETMTRMYEAELRGRRTEAATVHSRPTSATDSAPVAAPASLHSPGSTSASQADRRRVVSGDASPRRPPITAVTAAAVSAAGLDSVDPLTHQLIAQLHRSIDKHLETPAGADQLMTSRRDGIQL